MTNIIPFPARRPRFTHLDEYEVAYGIPEWNRDADAIGHRYAARALQEEHLRHAEQAHVLRDVVGAMRPGGAK